MVKTKKKRNKVYQGSIAAARPAVTRIAAVNRSAAGQWWYDHKRLARPVLIGAGILFVIILLTIGLIDLLV